MKLYTHATDSHMNMLRDWLLPTVKPEFEVYVGTSPQYGNGHWNDPQWGKNTRNKACTMLRAVSDNMGDVVVWADCDIQVFRPIKDRLLELLGDNDIAPAMDSPGQACSGFYVVRCNEKTLEFFTKIYGNDKAFNRRRGGSGTDQLVFNELLHTLTYTFLPTSEFWNRKFPLDFEVIRLQHANWIKGVENKIQAMIQLRKQYEEKHEDEFGA